VTGHSELSAGTGGETSVNACASLAYDYCVADCLRDWSLVDNAVCLNGAWGCARGYQLASTCPAQGCGVTQQACCDTTTGIVSMNGCGAAGIRSACPDNDVATSPWPRSTQCVPKSLAGRMCHSLDGQACEPPAVRCYDTSLAFVECVCSGLSSAVPVGTWQCSSYIGG
jgi:hypothetical protein